MKPLLLPALLFAALTLPASAGPNGEARGREIAEEIRRRASGFGGLSARLHMRLENRRGQTSERSLRLRTRETGDRGSQSLCMVDDPADVRGTALLSHSRPEGEDDQWLYLPAVQRTRRIAAQGRSGSFMGSEFSYEDFSDQGASKHHTVWLRDETLDGMECHVVERIPLDARATGYSRQVAWIEKDTFRMHRMDYYNRRSERIKTLTLSSFRLHGERFWHAEVMEMVNHLTGSRTVLTWSDVEYGIELDPSDFDRHRLPHLR